MKTNKYASDRTFGGQRVSVGQVVLIRKDESAPHDVDRDRATITPAIVVYVHDDDLVDVVPIVGHAVPARAGLSYAPAPEELTEEAWTFPPRV